MITPPEKVATPIVRGGAAGGQKRLGPLRDSKSIVVVAAVALPTPTASVKLAVTTASKVMRETFIITTLPSCRARPLRPASGLLRTTEVRRSTNSVTGQSSASD